MTMENRKLNIAIIGGGIGGLSAAAFLNQAGHQVTVFEQAPAFGEVGAGLVVAPNAVRLLRRIGALDKMLENAVRLEAGWEFRRWSDGTVLSVEDLDTRCAELYGEDTYVMHRAELLSAVQSAVPEQLLRLDSKVTSVQQNADGVELTLADGSTHQADVLIGADGVHSIVRQSMFEPGAAEYSGMCAFRSLVPAENVPEFAKRPVQTLWLGPDHHLVHYPISGGKYINLVAFAPAGEFSQESWSTTTELSVLLDEFAGWDPRLEQLIKAAERPGRWALLDRAPLKSWTDGRIALMGDAAHPMFPFFAQGAAQSIEDAATLSACLTRQPENPQAALATYESMRLERATKLQDLSHGRKEINHLPDGPEQRERDAELAQGDPLLNAGWIYSYDPEAELEKVEA